MKCYFYKARVTRLVSGNFVWSSDHIYFFPGFSQFAQAKPL